MFRLPPVAARTGKFSCSVVADADLARVSPWSASEAAPPPWGVEPPSFSSVESIRYALCSVVVEAGVACSVVAAGSETGTACSPAVPFTASGFPS